MEAVAVIMAGGSGERFWPLSRQQRPKQLLRLTPSGRMLVEETVERLRGVLPLENVYVLTSAPLQSLLRRALPQIPPANVIAEPMRRNTAACILLAAAVVAERFGEGAPVVVAAFPSDHLVEPVEEFQRCLRKALARAGQGRELVTIGIPPTRPETGYGYIEVDALLEDAEGISVYSARRFREKPSREVAEEFVQSGSFLWNSGMFFWRLDVLLHSFRIYAPQFWQHWEGLRQVVRSVWGQPVEGAYPGLGAVFAELPDISVDYAIAERAERIATVRATFRWDDVGAWDALERVLQPDAHGNVVNGDVILLESQGCIVVDARTQPQPLVTLLGLRDSVVVLTDDAVLCCAKSHVQQVRQLVNYLRQQGYEALL
ncbi:MAG: sugar phosphate nucleotidyltransferase [Candidatus Kapabacteria bacterium]|nr:sugar phosphate nucleotidyltransferase [Candidatus Kapabacteria bacterium]MDW8012457.1 sugar phosphate nucleotidyltransferase [Bacteroidota bacterium]